MNRKLPPIIARLIVAKIACIVVTIGRYRKLATGRQEKPRR
jgi:hypothetical protein